MPFPRSFQMILGSRTRSAAGSGTLSRYALESLVVAKLSSSHQVVSNTLISTGAGWPPSYFLCRHPLRRSDYRDLSSYASHFQASTSSF